MMQHGGISALVILLNDGHLEAWASATHTLHMLCSSTPSATHMIMQAGIVTCYVPYALHTCSTTLQQAYRPCCLFVYTTFLLWFAETVVST